MKLKDIALDILHEYEMVQTQVINDTANPWETEFQINKRRTELKKEIDRYKSMIDNAEKKQ